MTSVIVIHLHQFFIYEDIIIYFLEKNNKPLVILHVAEHAKDMLYMTCDVTYLLYKPLVFQY